MESMRCLKWAQWPLFLAFHDTHSELHAIVKHLPLQSSMSLTMILCRCFCNLANYHQTFWGVSMLLEYGSTSVQWLQAKFILQLTVHSNSACTCLRLHSMCLSCKFQWNRSHVSSAKMACVCGNLMGTGESTNIICENHMECKCSPLSWNCCPIG